MQAFHVSVLSLVVILSAAPGGAGFAGATQPGGSEVAGFAPSGACTGTVTDPANGTTVVSVQGARFGPSGGKTQAKLVAFGPHGQIKWVYNHSDGVVWSYDVDPLPNGNLFVTATRRGRTDLFEFDPRTQERVWTRVLDLTDTHDADMLNRTHVAIANMRNVNETTGENDDRLLIYNRKTDRIVWEWRFDARYPKTAGGNYTEDWTHVNDIDPVGEHHFLASPRNFDQVILVDRRTGDIDLRLGRDGNHSVLKRQHNPDYLESRAGRPTVLVADSENGRVVEYERRGGAWHRTWNLGGDGSFDWPRDADRLPNGNTLVTDSRGNRVLEVTPNGTVVWEVYAPWLTYETERIATGDGSRGPTIQDLNGTGSYSVPNGTSPSTAELEACNRALHTFRPGSWDPIGTSAGSGTGRTSGPGSDIVSDVPAPVLGGVVVLALAAVIGIVTLYRRQ